MKNKTLLLCGIIAILWYVAMNIAVPMFYPGYDFATYTISELSAINAPTQMLWMIPAIIYNLLFMAFGFGIRMSSKGKRSLRIAGAIIIVDGLLGFFWPPMHRREIIAAGGGSLTDTLHLVWAFIHLILMLLMIGFGAYGSGKGFRILSACVVIVFLVFGMLTAFESRGIDDTTPTPYVGIWERINISAYMLWVIVFAARLMKENSMTAHVSQTE